uniref:Uncharacterized protein n=1 Tax=Sphaerodactylus townsendi TaxID=933632 RepID=A0ACB8FDB1_9SAUR
MEDFLLTQVPLSNRFSVLSTDAAIPPDEELTEEAVTTAPAKGTNGANEAFGEKNDTHKKGEGQPADLLESSSLCKLIAETLEHIYGELRLLNSKMNKLSSGSPSYSPSRDPCIWPESKEPSYPRDKQMQTAKPSKLDDLGNLLPLIASQVNDFRELHSSHTKLDKERKTNRLDSTKQNQIPSRLSISPTVICNINPSGEAEQKGHPAHLPVEGALDQSTLTLPTNQVNLNSPQFDLDEGLNARSLLSPDRSLLPPVTDLGQGKEHKENSVDIDVELHPIRVTNCFQLESGKSWAQELLELKQTEPPP